MKFETTESFDADYRRLNDADAKLFREALKLFIPACDRYGLDASMKWPAALRVRDVERAPGVWEMTWSFSGPDGRATFEWISIDGSLALRWRRIGDHGIFKRP